MWFFLLDVGAFQKKLWWCCLKTFQTISPTSRTSSLTFHCINSPHSSGLSLFLSCKQIGDEGVEFFAHHISRKLTKLTHFKVDLGWYNALLLWKFLIHQFWPYWERTHNFLQRNWPKTGQAQTSWSPYSRVIPTTSIQSFSYSHSLNSLTDETIKALEDNIIKRLSGLKHLSIRIGQYSYFYLSGNLTLSFSSVSEVSSKALESLFIHIGQCLPGLTFLKVELL